MAPLFQVLEQQGHARRGRLTLAHGVVETPVFMPVGTYGAVKSLSPQEVKAVGSQIILGNTYHLYLRPGLEVLKQFGGLHAWMNWDRPLLTDSGGFQVFSLAEGRQMSEEGVTFRSHLDGAKVHLTPELSAEIQRTIGSDIAMVLDECVALPASETALKSALELSYRWAKRFLACPRKDGQKIFGIIQGGVDLNLRRQSLELTASLPIDGLAVGGLSVGEPHQQMMDTLEYLAPLMPPALPHYLMGVGTPRDLLEGVKRGIDMFDCVMPTRNARNGGFFTDEGLLNIRNAEHKNSEKSVAESCGCDCCQNYSRSYLRHLFATKEMLGSRLATIHNLHYYHAFMREIRQVLEIRQFPDFYEQRSPQLKRAYPDAYERGIKKAPGLLFTDPQGEM